MAGKPPFASGVRPHLEGSQRARSSFRLWRVATRLIEGRVCPGWNHAHLLNPRGQDRVAELQAKPASGNDVLLDCTPAPSATIDPHPLRRLTLAVKPSSPNPVQPLAEHPDRIKGVPRRDQHTIATVNIPLSYLFKRSPLLDDGL